MPKRMLIDAAHAEETRVVVLDGTRVEEFDFESRGKKQLRGNIYLAKVTRVEPSLQAAFIEYGGNRHGFLAFNEIHPDYFQIPTADREALMRDADDDEDDHAPAAAALDEDGEEIVAGDDEDVVDAQEERRRRRMLRRYKIQEVIRRRQIMLVQVVKEERGTKGAALTTYLSLAGRYGVLMPNTDRGGGISRKITTATDRKRLKSVVAGLGVPKGMGLIVRTAGAKRTKAEIKRDYDYLERLWENIRDTTLHSVAPALIYEEEDLVKRAIRDLYDKELEGIWVEGEAGYKEARDFIRMLMPSQAKKVIQYTEPTPLFVRHRIEDALSQIYTPVVPLKSGGYLVINQTEALVAIDVNSGRATRERNIEATALKTNMEAAEESARQLRLRDLAGLVVIDFIDMEEAKNNRAVEKKLKDALAEDRARVQMGRISSFGLMEISRQRRRTGVLEATTMVCPHCVGMGRVRTVESAALAALRAVETEALKGGGHLVVRAPPAISLYILNEKREDLSRIAHVHGLAVSVSVDDALGADDFNLDRISSVAVEARAWEPPAPAKVDYVTEDDDDVVDEDEDEEIEDDEDEDDDAVAAAPRREASEIREPREAREGGREGREGGREGGRGRRRRRRGGRDDRADGDRAAAPAAPRPEAAGDEDEDSAARSRRRRGRRGGRRMREDGRAQDVYAWSWPARSDDPYQWRGPVQAALPAPPANDAPAPVAAEAAPVAELAPSADAPAPEVIAEAPAVESDIWVELPAETEKPKRARRSRAKGKGAEDAEAGAVAEAPAPEPVVAEAEPEPAPEPAPVAAKAPRSRAKAAAAPAPEPVAEPVVEPVAAPEPEPVAAAPAEPDPNEISGAAPAPRRGWWRRG